MKTQKKLIPQSILFNRSKYKNKTSVRNWCKKNKYKIPKGNKIDITEKYYRVRLRDPWRFKKPSFRTITINKNIKIIMGKLK